MRGRGTDRQNRGGRMGSEGAGVRERIGEEGVEARNM